MWALLDALEKERAARRIPADAVIRAESRATKAEQAAAAAEVVRVKEECARQTAGVRAGEWASSVGHRHGCEHSTITKETSCAKRRRRRRQHIPPVVALASSLSCLSVNWVNWAALGVQG